MKKLLLILSVLILSTFTLYGCGNNEDLAGEAVSPAKAHKLADAERILTMCQAMEKDMPEMMESILEAAKMSGNGKFIDQCNMDIHKLIDTYGTVFNFDFTNGPTEDADSDMASVTGKAIKFLRCRKAGGVDYNKKGTLLFRLKIAGIVITFRINDFCSSTVGLNEFKCNGNIPGVIRYTCPGICTGGACKNVTTTTIPPSHLECDSNLQCVSVSGPGVDQCNTSSDCNQTNSTNTTDVAAIIESIVPQNPYVHLQFFQVNVRVYNYGTEAVSNVATGLHEDYFGFINTRYTGYILDDFNHFIKDI